MNLNLIHSLTCAKYSIIKVTHLLYDLTFPDISGLQGSHIPLVIKKISGFSFCSNTGSCLLWELPSSNVLDNLFKKCLHVTQISQPAPWSQIAILHVLGCFLCFKHGFNHANATPRVSLKTPHAAGHKKHISNWLAQ